MDPLWILLVSLLAPLPCRLAYRAFSAIMKLYALCTLHETGWGTRAGIGDRAWLCRLGF
jgi:hypothetical protein